MAAFAFKFSYAQEIDRQIEFELSNDKFANKDKYFSSGAYISYQRILGRSFILSKTDENKLQTNLVVGNEIFTPTNLFSLATTDFDRPFAGWLFGKFEVRSIEKSSVFALSLETGITGKESLAETLQVGWHNLVGINGMPSWLEQIEFKWLFNIKLEHICNWQPNTHNSLQYRIAPSLGTKDIYIENDFSYFFGSLNPFKNSARSGIVDAIASKEFYGYISVGYKYVAHNSLIQGSVFKEDRLFTTDTTRHILKTEVGAVLSSNRNTFKISYNFNTKETPLSTSHIYGSLVYARSF